MTRSVSTGVDPRFDVESLRTLVLLSLGDPPSAESVDWTAVLALADRERLLGVVWKAAAEGIRQHAPASIHARWQRKALLLGLHAERQLELLAEATTALQRRGVDVVVLKGAPLAQQLYGDFTVRPSLDLDLYVPAQQRPSAKAALIDLGWRPMNGTAPEEETFERTDGARLFRLEVHSSALDDALLEHVRLPVEQELQRVGQYILPAQGGRFLPAYLATHLVKHHEKPLLWAVDFFQLWTKLDDAARGEAIAAARSLGASRHLQWAVALVGELEAVRSAGAATPAALHALARRVAPRDNASRLVQLVSLSQSPMAAFRVLAGRVWPAAWRRGWRAAPGYFWRRTIRWSYRHLVFERPLPNDARDDSHDIISLAARDCEQRVIDALGRAPVWLAPSDGTMEPAIPPFGFARIVPIGERKLRVGDVVLARTAGGRCVLRRVMTLGGSELALRPDADQDDAQLVARSALLGVCDVVDVGGRCIPISDRPHGSLGTLRAIIRSQLGMSEATRGTPA